MSFLDKSTLFLFNINFRNWVLCFFLFIISVSSSHFLMSNTCVNVGIPFPTLDLTGTPEGIMKFTPHSASF
jgi:hypothetical protein